MKDSTYSHSQFPFLQTEFLEFTFHHTKKQVLFNLLTHLQAGRIRSFQGQSKKAAMSVDGDNLTLFKQQHEPVIYNI
jgi:hypothetical protein